MGGKESRNIQILTTTTTRPAVYQYTTYTVPGIYVVVVCDARTSSIRQYRYVCADTLHTHHYYYTTVHTLVDALRLLLLVVVYILHDDGGFQQQQQQQPQKNTTYSSIVFFCVLYRHSWYIMWHLHVCTNFANTTKRTNI